MHAKTQGDLNRASRWGLARSSFDDERALFPSLEPGRSDTPEAFREAQALFSRIRREQARFSSEVRRDDARSEELTTRRLVGRDLGD